MSGCGKRNDRCRYSAESSIAPASDAVYCLLSDGEDKRRWREVRVSKSNEGWKDEGNEETKNAPTADAQA